MKITKKGSLFVVEGTDCSGKDTQAKLLLERLIKEGLPAKMLSFPRYSQPTGRIVGECYLGRGNPSWFGNATQVDPRIASLYYAADRLDESGNIKEGLERGTVYVANRYVESNMGHQGGKLKGQERLDVINLIDKLEYGLLGIPKPDSVVFLYMPHQVAAKLNKERGGIKDDHENDPDHLRNAEESYLQLAEMFGWIKIDCAPDGTKKSLRSKEDIHEEIYSKLAPLLTQRS